MASKILIAVDESKNSMKAVNYVAKGMNSAATVTLFSVLPDATAACGLEAPPLRRYLERVDRHFVRLKTQRRIPSKHSCKKPRRSW
jgi:hypothetical protein